MTRANENFALSGSILWTFLYYAVPSMIGLIAITTSNLVDGVFVGNYVGGEALAAVTLLLPVLTLLFAIALMFAIGGSVAAGRHIGAGDRVAASNVFSQTMMATVATVASFALVSYAFEQSMYRILDVPKALEPLVGEYFGVIRWVLVVQLTTMVLYYFVRADGHPILATTALVVGALGNIALDFVFVVHLELGLAGAAYALAIAQALQCAVLSSYYFSRDRTLCFVPWQRDFTLLTQASYNGVSEFINEISVGLIFWLLNHLLIESAGVEGVAAFSVVNYFVFLSLMLSYGVADALHLLVSQNLGARNRERIEGFLRTAVACSLTIGAGLTVTILGWRTAVTGWFLDVDDAAIADDAVRVVLVMWPLFLVNGTNVIMSCYLTAIQQARPSALIASMRGLLLPGTLLVLLSVLFGYWPLRARFSDWAFLGAIPLAEWLTFAAAIAFCYRHRPAALELGPYSPVKEG